MKKVILLSTGGTIASIEDSETGLIMAGKQSGEALLSQCNMTYIKKYDIQVDVISIFQIPSNQMNFENCFTLIKKMEQLLQEQSIDGFVITHGTDTLEESAYFTSLYWNFDIPVVFTGAQFSPTENNTDAFHNITSAILVAAHNNSQKVGVTVVFNDHILSARYATKSHASNIDGFSCPKTGPLGIIDFGRVHYFHIPTYKETYSIPNRDLKKVELIKSYVGMNTGVFDYFINEGISGLVIEAFGRGHVDLDTAKGIERATVQGLSVVITTTCANGEVATVYGFQGGLNDLLKKGAISGGDYNSKKARIKLIALLSAGAKKDDITTSFINS